MVRLHDSIANPGPMALYIGGYLNGQFSHDFDDNVVVCSHHHKRLRLDDIIEQVKRHIATIENVCGAFLE